MLPKAGRASQYRARRYDDHWPAPDVAVAGVREVSPEHDESPAARRRGPAVPRGERRGHRCRREALPCAVRSCDPRCGRLGDPPGTWPQARARAPGAVHRARERPRAIVLRAMGDLPSFRAVWWMVPQSGSRKKVDLSLAIGFGYSERAAELKVGEGIEHAGSKRWLLGRAGSGGGLGQSRPRGPADARDPPERAHAHAHPRWVVGF